MSTPAPTTGPPGPQPENYFSEFRKGEVNELMTMLRSALATRDPLKQKEAIQKVIAYMTLGIDVSALFRDLIMATNTKDLVQKKLVYQYLCHYAPTNQELSLLAVNTLLKDCRDSSPMVRGLALRSLCSLRLPSLVEYLLPQIQAGLLDSQAYVRKTAVMGCLKLFYISPKTIRGTEIVDKLYDMLRDRDPQVVANVVNCLNEILAEEGGMALNKSIIVHLLNKLNYLSEWAQCAVLDLVARFRPPQKEIVDYLNLLESRMNHANGAVVFATIKVFLNLTQDYVTLYAQVLSRVRTPLLTVISTGSDEMKFTALQHVNLIINRAPTVFVADYKHFFCGYNEPSYLKHVKVEILEKVATKQNMHEIVSELSEYAKDIDVDLSQCAVRSIAKIAIKLPQVAEHSLDRLISFLDFGLDHITGTALGVMKDVLRRFPELAPRVSAELPTWLRKNEDAAAKSACIWMLGEFGLQVEDAPYLLEEQINDWKNLDASAKLQLLTACSRLFFERPGEMQPILGALFTVATLDQNIDVHDRAYLYYRLFAQGVEEARRIIAAPKELLKTFAEDQSYLVIDRLFEEFNTLAVMYGMPSERFLGSANDDEEKKLQSESSGDDSSSSESEQAGEGGGGGGGGEGSSGSSSDSDSGSSSGSSSGESGSEATSDDEAGGGGGGAAAVKAQPAPAPAPAKTGAATGNLLDFFG